MPYDLNRAILLANQHAELTAFLKSQLEVVKDERIRSIMASMIGDLDTSKEMIERFQDKISDKAWEDVIKTYDFSMEMMESIKKTNKYKELNK